MLAIAAADAGTGLKHEYSVVLKKNINNYGLFQQWTATVPELLGCVPRGATAEAVLNDIDKGIDVWISINREAGRVIPLAEQSLGLKALREGRLGTSV